MSVLIGHPTVLFPGDITMDTLAGNDFNRKKSPPPPAPVQPLAWVVSLWYKWRQVIHLYVASIELSAQKYHRRCTEPHITALQPRSAGSGFTSPPPHLPHTHNLEETEDGWRDGHGGSITAIVQTCEFSKSRSVEPIGDDK